MNYSSETSFAVPERAMDVRLCYGNNKNSLERCVDADWGNCTDDRKPYTGFVVIAGGGPISWDSRRQMTVALSSTVAKYMSIAKAKGGDSSVNIHERGGLKQPTNITGHDDNMGTLKLVENPVFHGRSKDKDFISNAVKNGLFEMEHVPSEKTMVDNFTKGPPKPKPFPCITSIEITTSQLRRSVTRFVLFCFSGINRYS